MHLPTGENLPTHHLAASLHNTVATYKFYWLLAIIEQAEQGKTEIAKHTLFANMVANAWYTVNYFRVSFGKSDLIHQSIKAITEIEQLQRDIRKDDLIAILEHSQKSATRKTLSHFNQNVPHWFLSAWFPRQNKTAIYNASQHFHNNCLYALHNDRIIINQIWTDYLKDNAGILKAFCHWKLCLFLQARNPNVPDIANKLIKPPFRGTLNKHKNQYWNIVFKELGSIDCIFTNTRITADKYALDHFVPHAFVSHDLIWNLAPIDEVFNSRKSDRLPSIEKHFNAFFNLQKTAYEIISHHQPKNKFLQDYLTIYPTLNAVQDFRYERFKENIAPLLVIAGNNGFSFL